MLELAMIAIFISVFALLAVLHIIAAILMKPKVKIELPKRKPKVEPRIYKPAVPEIKFEDLEDNVDLDTLPEFDNVDLYTE